MPTAEALLRVATGELGTKEFPEDSNKVKYNTAYYGREVSGSAYPWCAVFVWWCFQQAGVELPVKTASCTALRNAAKRAGMWVTGNYKPGDVVIYDWTNDGTLDHCGIIETVTNSGVVAIEGNTAVGNDSNGGAVMRRTRTTAQINGAVRPLYEEEENIVRYQYLKDIPDTFRPTIETLMNAGIIQGDGSDKAGNGDVIDLTHDQVRTLVFVYRGGGFDAKLKAAGLAPAVQ